MKRIDYDQMSFLVCPAPKDDELKRYKEEFQRNNVTDIVVACEQLYDPKFFEPIRYHALWFKDGTAPDEEHLSQFLSIVQSIFYSNGSAPLKPTVDKGTAGLTSIPPVPPSPPAVGPPRIAIHCRAGIGRSATLVICALIKFGHMSSENAIVTVCGIDGDHMLNDTQLDFVQHYRPNGGCCAIV